MTISRFSIAFLGLMLAGCAKNMPPANTELGRIVRIANYGVAAAKLKLFAEARLNDPNGLRRELERAGFKRSTFRDDEGTACESFHWKGMKWGSVFPSVMLVNLCGKEVFTNAGQIAP